MKRFTILIQILLHSLVFTLMISACGAPVPQATSIPTLNAVELQGTIAAGLFTVVAQTQAAIPTATPSPTLTSTPTSSPTVPPLPTEGGATFTALPGVSGGNSGVEDPCIHQVLPASLEGQTIRIRIDNPTKGTVMISVYLQQTGPQSVCGYRSYSLATGESLVINDLVEGCYTIWAWNPDPDEYFMVTNGTSCLNTSNSWTFDITTNGIRLRS